MRDKVREGEEVKREDKEGREGSNVLWMEAGKGERPVAKYFKLSLNNDISINIALSVCLKYEFIE